MSVPTAGDIERDFPQIVSHATIANIVRQRAEEIFEMVRDRLADSPFAAEPQAPIVLGGGGPPRPRPPRIAAPIPLPPARGRPAPGAVRPPQHTRNGLVAVPP